MFSNHHEVCPQTERFKDVLSVSYSSIIYQDSAFFNVLFVNFRLNGEHPFARYDVYIKSWPHNYRYLVKTIGKSIEEVKPISVQYTSTKDIALAIKAAQGAQSRAVTPRDFIAMSYKMPNKFESYKIMLAINAYLRKTKIKVICATKVIPEAHARFSAIWREYKYTILNRISPPALNEGIVYHQKNKLNIKLMSKASQVLIGTHDFTSFRSTNCQSQSPIKTTVSYTHLTLPTKA